MDAYKDLLAPIFKENSPFFSVIIGPKKIGKQAKICAILEEYGKAHLLFPLAKYSSECEIVYQIYTALQPSSSLRPTSIQGFQMCLEESSEELFLIFSQLDFRRKSYQVFVKLLPSLVYLCKQKLPNAKIVISSSKALDFIEDKDFSYIYRELSSKYFLPLFDKTELKEHLFSLAEKFITEDPSSNKKILLQGKVKIKISVELAKLISYIVDADFGLRTDIGYYLEMLKTIIEDFNADNNQIESLLDLGIDVLQNYGLHSSSGSQKSKLHGLMCGESKVMRLAVLAVFWCVSRKESLDEAVFSKTTLGARSLGISRRKVFNKERLLSVMRNLEEGLMPEDSASADKSTLSDPEGRCYRDVDISVFSAVMDKLLSMGIVRKSRGSDRLLSDIYFEDVKHLAESLAIDISNWR